MNILSITTVTLNASVTSIYGNYKVTHSLDVSSEVRVIPD